jgi:hypothetical protein
MFCGDEIKMYLQEFPFVVHGDKLNIEIFTKNELAEIHFNGTGH